MEELQAKMAIFRLCGYPVVIAGGTGTSKEVLVREFMCGYRAALDRPFQLTVQPQFSGLGPRGGLRRWRAPTPRQPRVVGAW